MSFIARRIYSASPCIYSSGVASPCVKSLISLKTCAIASLFVSESQMRLIKRMSAERINHTIADDFPNLFSSSRCKTLWNAKKPRTDQTMNKKYDSVAIELSAKRLGRNKKTAKTTMRTNPVPPAIFSFARCSFFASFHAASDTKL